MMSEFLTPKVAMISAAFMTPPDSHEKDNQEQVTRSVTSPIEFSLITPMKRSLRFHDASDDFFSSLYLRYNHVSHQILSLLSPCDLLNCLGVCRTWREAVLSKESYKTKIRDYKKECKRNEENQPPLHHSYLQTRKPLARLPTNISAVTTYDPLSKSPPKPSSLSNLSSLRPCPRCSSPRAKKINSRRAVCDECQYDFCCCCFEKTHEKDCGGLTSPKRHLSRPESIVGGKESKKRRKRL